MRRRFGPSAAGFVLLVALAGCGKSSSTAPGDQGPTAKQALDDLGLMLKTIADEKKRPPAKPADLEPYEAVHLSATLGIHQKRIVYVWGAGRSDGTAVVAYDANAESAGGYVLLQNGTVKEMTAEEFKAAPRAKK